MAKALSFPGAMRNRIARAYPETVIVQLQEIEADLGGRDALVGMLALAPLTPDLHFILGLLGDPRSKGQSLAAICAMGNVLPGELLRQLASAALLRGKVLAQQKIATGIAAVAEDVMRRAAPYEDVCNGGCSGTGSITQDPSPTNPNPGPEPCEVCRGTGKLIYRPDLERQKLAIEMAQLLPKSGGINILNQQNNQGGSVSGGQGLAEQVTKLTDRILYGSGTLEEAQERPVIDSAADPGAEHARAPEDADPSA